MTNYDLTTLPTETAIKLVMKDFGFSKTDAAHFVALAQGKEADDVTGKAFNFNFGKPKPKGKVMPGKGFAKLMKGKAYGGAGMLETGSGNRKTGSLGLTKISTLKIQAGGIDKPHNANAGPKFFKPGRKINLLLGKTKDYDPKA